MSGPEERRFKCEGDWFVARFGDSLTFTTPSGKTYAYQGDDVPPSLEAVSADELCDMVREAVRRTRGGLPTGAS